MNALVALECLVHEVVAVLAVEDRDEALVEWEVEDPVEQEDLVAQEVHRRVHILLLTVARGKVHVEDKRDDGQLVDDREDHQGPVEKGGPARAYRLDNAAVVAQLSYEVQEKLVFPSEFLNY